MSRLDEALLDKDAALLLVDGELLYSRGYENLINNIKSLILDILDESEEFESDLGSEIVFDRETFIEKVKEL